MSLPWAGTVPGALAPFHRKPLRLVRREDTGSFFRGIWGFETHSTHQGTERPSLSLCTLSGFQAGTLIPNSSNPSLSAPPPHTHTHTKDKRHVRKTRHPPTIHRHLLTPGAHAHQPFPPLHVCDSTRKHLHGHIGKGTVPASVGDTGGQWYSDQFTHRGTQFFTGSSRAHRPKRSYVSQDSRSPTHTDTPPNHPAVNAPYTTRHHGRELPTKLTFNDGVDLRNLQTGAWGLSWPPAKNWPRILGQEAPRESWPLRDRGPGPLLFVKED